jgi:hypothetical protein
MPRYRHTQTGWVIIGALLLPVAILSVVAFAARTWLPLISIVPLVLLLPLFASLTVEVDDEAVAIRFGSGLIHRRVSLADIALVSGVVNCRWCGWGIRIIPDGRLYNVSGARAVELLLADDRRVRIGTDDPEGLAAAIRGAMSTVVSRSALPPSRDRTALLPAIIIPIVGGVVVVAVIVGMRPIEVTTSTAGIDVRGAGYNAHIDAADVVRVHLDDTLPTISRRTNGFAASGRLRGHFRLADGRAAQLFVTRDRPPFLTVETRRDVVIVNFDDPARTRTLFTELSGGVR